MERHVAVSKADLAEWRFYEVATSAADSDGAASSTFIKCVPPAHLSDYIGAGLLRLSQVNLAPAEGSDLKTIEATLQSAQEPVLLTLEWQTKAVEASAGVPAQATRSGISASGRSARASARHARVGWQQNLAEVEEEPPPSSKGKDSAADKKAGSSAAIKSKGKVEPDVIDLCLDSESEPEEVQVAANAANSSSLSGKATKPPVNGDQDGNGGSTSDVELVCDSGAAQSFSSSSLSSAAAAKPLPSLIPLLPLHSCVRIPPFGFGHVTAITSHHADGSRSTVSSGQADAAVKASDSSSGADETVTIDLANDGAVSLASAGAKSTSNVASTSDGGRRVVRATYRVALWSGATAYVPSDSSGAPSPLLTRDLGGQRLALYPSVTSAGSVPLTLGDLYRLNPGLYLNDALLEVYMRYVWRERMTGTGGGGDARARVHMFNSFFFSVVRKRAKAAADVRDKARNAARRSGGAGVALQLPETRLIGSSTNAGGSSKSAASTSAAGAGAASASSAVEVPTSDEVVLDASDVAAVVPEPSGSSDSSVHPANAASSSSSSSFSSSSATNSALSDLSADGRRWSQVDPFQHDFLFVPVNDDQHWSVAVICYPALLLPRTPAAATAMPLQTSYAGGSSVGKPLIASLPSLSSSQSSGTLTSSQPALLLVSQTSQSSDPASASSAEALLSSASQSSTADPPVRKRPAKAGNALPGAAVETTGARTAAAMPAAAATAQKGKRRMSAFAISPGTASAAATSKVAASAAVEGIAVSGPASKRAKTHKQQQEDAELSDIDVPIDGGQNSLELSGEIDAPVDLPPLPSSATQTAAKQSDSAEEALLVDEALQPVVVVSSPVSDAAADKPASVPGDGTKPSAAEAAEVEMSMNELPQPEETQLHSNSSGDAAAELVQAVAVAPDVTQPSITAPAPDVMEIIETPSASSSSASSAADAAGAAVFTGSRAAQSSAKSSSTSRPRQSRELALLSTDATFGLDFSALASSVTAAPEFSSRHRRTSGGSSSSSSSSASTRAAVDMVSPSLAQSGITSSMHRQEPQVAAAPASGRSRRSNAGKAHGAKATEAANDDDIIVAAIAGGRSSAGDAGGKAAAAVATTAANANAGADEVMVIEEGAGSSFSGRRSSARRGASATSAKVAAADEGPKASPSSSSSAAPTSAALVIPLPDLMNDVAEAIKEAADAVAAITANQAAALSAIDSAVGPGVLRALLQPIAPVGMPEAAASSSSSSTSLATSLPRDFAAKNQQLLETVTVDLCTSVVTVMAASSAAGKGAGDKAAARDTSAADDDVAIVEGDSAGPGAMASYEAVEDVTDSPKGRVSSSSSSSSVGAGGTAPLSGFAAFTAIKPDSTLQPRADGAALRSPAAYAAALATARAEVTLAEACVAHLHAKHVTSLDQAVAQEEERSRNAADGTTAASIVDDTVTASASSAAAAAARDAAYAAALIRARRHATLRAAVYSHASVAATLQAAREAEVEAAAARTRLAALERAYHNARNREMQFLRKASVKAADAAEDHAAFAAKALTKARDALTRLARGYYALAAASADASSSSASASSSASSSSDCASADLTSALAQLQQLQARVLTLTSMEAHAHALSTCLLDVQMRVQARISAHVSGSIASGGEWKGCLAEWRTAKYRCQLTSEDVAREVEQAQSADPVPCILFLDSLKAHSLQPVARMLRLYLQDQFRSRYMSEGEKEEEGRHAQAQVAADRAAKGKAQPSTDVTSGGGGKKKGAAAAGVAAGGKRQREPSPAESSSSSSSSSSLLPRLSSPWLADTAALFRSENCPAQQPDALPRQSNHCDCGVFVLAYAERFCVPLLPHITPAQLSSGLRHVFGAHWFQQEDIPRKRREMMALMGDDIANRPHCRST